MRAFQNAIELMPRCMLSNCRRSEKECVPSFHLRWRQVTLISNVTQPLQTVINYAPHVPVHHWQRFYKKKPDWFACNRNCNVSKKDGHLELSIAAHDTFLQIHSFACQAHQMNKSYRTWKRTWCRLYPFHQFAQFTQMENIWQRTFVCGQSMKTFGRFYAWAFKFKVDNGICIHFSFEFVF